MMTNTEDLGQIPQRGEFNASRAFDDWFVGQIEENLSALRKRASRLTRGSHVSDDLVQMSCLRAWQARASFDPHQNMAPWLFTILRNVWLDELRKSKGQARFVTAIDTETLAVAEAPAHQGEIIDLQRAIHSLQSQFRDVVLLRAVLGLSHAEVADLLGMTPVSARKTYSRALARLRDDPVLQTDAGLAVGTADQALMDEALRVQASLLDRLKVA